MAISKALIASLLISLLVIHLIEAETMNSNCRGHSRHKKIDCWGKCKARCRLSSRPKRCKRACGTCCARCNCVPPGTFGNHEVCPCYANMTTHGGRRKCP